MRAYFYDARRGAVWSRVGVKSLQIIEESTHACNATVDGGVRMMRCALSSTSMYVVKLIVYGTVAITSACLHFLFTKPFFFSCRVLRAGLLYCLPQTNEKGQVYHPLQPQASLQVSLIPCRDNTPPPTSEVFLPATEHPPTLRAAGAACIHTSIASFLVGRWLLLLRMPTRARYDVLYFIQPRYDTRNSTLERPPQETKLERREQEEGETHSNDKSQKHSPINHYSERATPPPGNQRLGPIIADHIPSLNNLDLQ